MQLAQNNETADATSGDDIAAKLKEYLSKFGNCYDYGHINVRNIWIMQTCGTLVYVVLYFNLYCKFGRMI